MVKNTNNIARLTSLMALAEKPETLLNYYLAAKKELEDLYNEKAKEIQLSLGKKDKII